MGFARRSWTVALVMAVLDFTRPAASYAQLRLSVEEAVDAALKSRPLLKAEAERVAAAEGRKRQAGVSPNPEFEFSSENLAPGQSYSRDVDTVAAVTWPLDILGKRGPRVAFAGQAVARTQAEAELTRRQVTQTVRLAYWNARGAQERQQLLQSSVSNFQRVIDYHAAQVTAGTIAEQDLLRVRLEGERIQIAAHLATIDATKARARLLKEAGLTERIDVVLTDPLDRLASPLAAVPFENVLAGRSEARVAAASVEEARANVSVEDVAARPDLAVLFGYKRTQSPTGLAGINTAVAGVTLTLPFLDRNQGNREAAAAELRRQEHLRADTETSIRADVQAALQEYEMRRAEVIETLQPLREHAATLAAIARAAYQQGGVELLRLLDSERLRLEADSAWVDGMVAFQQSVVNLEAAQGVVR